MISRNTVVRAYDLLLMEGIVDLRPASRSMWPNCSPASRSYPPPQELSDRGLQIRMPLPLRQGRVQSALQPVRNRLLFDFFPGRPSAELFPLKTWRRLLQANLSHGGAAGLTQYGDPAGLPSLRTAIANHLAASRALSPTPRGS